MTIFRHLSPEDLAEREQVPLATVYKWNSEGTGPPFMRIGRHVRYQLSDVESWETAHRVGQPTIAGAATVAVRSGP